MRGEEAPARLSRALTALLGSYMPETDFDSEFSRRKMKKFVKVHVDEKQGVQDILDVHVDEVAKELRRTIR